MIVCVSVTIVCMNECVFKFIVSTIPVTLTQRHNSVCEGSCVIPAIQACTILYNTGLIHSDDLHVHTSSVTLSCDQPCDHVLS